MIFGGFLLTQFLRAGSFRITSTHCMSYHCDFSSDLLYFLLMAHAQILN